MLCHIDAELEALRLQELALIRRLERVRQDARAACEEFRTHEAQMLFVESSSRYPAGPDTLRRLRDWLDSASQQYQELAARAESATAETDRDFELAHRRIEVLHQRRQTLEAPPDLVRIYERSAWIGVSPRILPVERGRCSGCAAPAEHPPDGELQTCSGCRRLLYWRQVG